MISAFSKGARVLGEPRYLEAAQKALHFVLTRLYDGNTLKRRFRDGEAAVNGFLDDYAFLIAALLDIYEAGFDPSHLETALALTTKMRELFEDREGAFFTTAAGDASLVMRMKDDYDGAEPSGNSVALMDLLRLANFTDNHELREAAERTLRALSRRIAAQPAAVPQMLAGFGELLAKKQQIVIVGDPKAEPVQALLETVNRRFLPHSVLFVIDSGETRRKLSRYLPVLSSMLNDGHAYVCQDYACQLPVGDAEGLIELLNTSSTEPTAVKASALPRLNRAATVTERSAPASTEPRLSRSALPRLSRAATVTERSTPPQPSRDRHGAVSPRLNRAATVTERSTPPQPSRDRQGAVYPRLPPNTELPD